MYLWQNYTIARGFASPLTGSEFSSASFFFPQEKERINVCVNNSAFSTTIARGPQETNV